MSLGKPKFLRRHPALPHLALANLLLVATPLLAQGEAQARTVVTVMPPNGASAPAIAAGQIEATVGGKRAQVSAWAPLRGEQAGLQLVILIDNSARTSLGLQYSDIKNFIQKLPPAVQVGVAYMQNGRAVMAQNITTERNLVADAFRLPSGPAGVSASPYFCLSDLVKNWPNGNNTDRREVLMITDGVDLYYGLRYDPNDPYVQGAIADAQRAGVIVHSIFYRDTGRFDRSQWTEAGAQSYLSQVSQGTGGRAYWIGFGNPVSFAPFLDELHTRLENQYELGLIARPQSKAGLQTLKLKVNAPKVKIEAPSMVFVPGSESAGRP